MKLLFRTAALAVLVSSAFVAPAQAPSGLTISRDNRTIAVTATDSVTKMADVATVHIGFVVYAIDHDTAYAEGSHISNAVMAALKAAGVPADSIESESQNLGEVQPYQVSQIPEAERAKRKWMLSQSWTVRTIADEAARMLDIAVKAGANQSGQIDWSLTDDNAAQAEAAAKALQRARSVAETMARGLNVRLGQLVYASNEMQTTPVRPVMMDFKGRAAAAPLPLAINPRHIEKSATVYAVFAIE